MLLKSRYTSKKDLYSLRLFCFQMNHMYKSYIPYLQHILDECLYIRSAISDEMQMEEFLRDETLKRAVTRSLSIIGEATKKIPADVKYAWQGISWRQMAGMRDRLVHDYMGVNYYIVWDVA